VQSYYRVSANLAIDEPLWRYVQAAQINQGVRDTTFDSAADNDSVFPSSRGSGVIDELHHRTGVNKLMSVFDR